jgi:hypothetical protein
MNLNNFQTVRSLQMPIHPPLTDNGISIEETINVGC